MPTFLPCSNINTEIFGDTHLGLWAWFVDKWCPLHKEVNHCLMPRQWRLCRTLLLLQIVTRDYPNYEISLWASLSLQISCIHVQLAIKGLATYQGGALIHLKTVSCYERTSKVYKPSRAPIIYSNSLRVVTWFSHILSSKPHRRCYSSGNYLLLWTCLQNLQLCTNPWVSICHTQVQLNVEQ